MTDWQPIETAPIGIDVLFCSTIKSCTETCAPVGDWAKIAIGQVQIKKDKMGRFIDVIHLFRIGNQLLKRGTAIPTHWMPLPNPPST